MRAIVSASALWLAACGSPTMPAAADPFTPAPGAHTGPVGIEYISANVAPGSTIAGCGPAIPGCAGRLQLTFRLHSIVEGPVLRAAATLHGANKAACLSASSLPFALPPNATVQITLVFDQTNPSCGLPFEASDMGVNVEGPVQVASRQEFRIAYRFMP